jgi:hypothetical protein
MQRWAVWLLVLCLVLTGLAGCTTLSEAVDTTPGADRTHPFAGETVTVTVDGTDRERALVDGALDYWAANGDEYAGFSVDFRVLDGAATPADGAAVDVRFRETVDCGDSDYSAGCAPRLNASTGVDRPAPVQIQRGLADDATRLVVRHEAGHLLGLDHDDRPQAVMAHETNLATLPRPNASERPVPWNDTTLTVAIDNTTVPDGERERYATEMDYALAYLAEGADGAVPANVTVRRVGATDDADVTVRAGPTDTCGSGSCLLAEGTDPDQDGVIERYSGAEIRLIDVDVDAVSWHVTRQLLGVVGTDDLPDQLDDSSATERRGEWHG